MRSSQSQSISFASGSVSSALRALRFLLTMLLVVGIGLTPGDALAKKKKKKKKKKKAPIAKVIADGELVIFSTTNGAIVEIDGKKLGTVPFKDPIKMKPGMHSIRVYLRGWSEFSDTFEIKAGDETELEIDLLPSGGLLKVNADKPGATVKVNDKVVGVTPFDGDIPVGKAELKVTLPGHKDFVQTMNVAPGKEYKIDVVLEQLASVSTGPEFYETWWFWTIVGVAVAGGTTAAVVLSQPADKAAPIPDFVITIP